MSFPTIDGIVATNGSTAAANPSIDLPTVVAGKLGLVIFTVTQTFSGTPSPPTGWTHLFNAKPSGDARSGDRDQILYRVLDGGEGSSLAIGTNGVSLKHHALALVIGNIDSGVVPELSVEAVGTSNAPNPASLSPAAGLRDYLWLWSAIMEGTVGVPVGSPTDYSLPSPSTVATSGGGGATNSRQAIASRQLAAASEDPPAWTWPSSEDWVAWTIAIAGPAAGGGGPSQAVRTMHQHRMRRMR